MKTSKAALVNLINQTNGKMFTVEFVKKSGEKRVMNARTGVKKHLRGGDSTIKDKSNLISVYDVKTGGYRCINVDTLLAAKIGGKEYQVEESSE